MQKNRQKIDVLGVSVDDLGLEEAVVRILGMVEAKVKGKYVVTVNSEFVMMARRNPHFAEILKDADLAVADGWWVALSKLILGGKEHGRVAGVDLIETICKESAKKPITIGFLGGFGNVAQEVSKRQKKKNSHLKVVFAEAGDSAIGYDSKLKSVLDKIGRVDVLFVAYGMGKQEFWIERMGKKLNVGVFIGVGGSFDYLSGVKMRSPKLWQNLGFEWLWRLLMEPSRIWRMRVLPVFLLLVLAQWFKREF